jgi:transcriptional regulator with XRE-family HTH domain
MNPVAEKIQKERIRAGLTEKMLARKCSLSESYIRQVEAGKKIISEEAAHKILQALDVEPDVLHQGIHEQQPTSQADKMDHLPKVSSAQHLHEMPVESTDQWSDALAHIIRRFPVEHLINGKITGHKELPVLGKKIDGCPLEKIRFYQVPDSTMQEAGIHTNDHLMVCETEEIINGGFYVIETHGRRIIRKLWKDQKKTISMTKGLPGESPANLNSSQVKIIGRCIKVEHFLIDR